ncbi:hypothetical protein Pmani_037419 [Petrolisthes manimaculis]|uniref:Uncharacterized protein n=1 Tax=Petrolisthes manimaculis TaxID=1843537 RepID=A0AAE1TLI7_9EUCA|nr:hypothetical protein Pmani_037419 [Petrolisthes manimaculis]
METAKEQAESLRPLVVPALGHSGPPPWSLRPSTLVTPALHPGHSGPPPWSLRPSTLVTPALHPGHSGPPPWSLRPSTPVNAAFYSSFIYL